MPSLRCLTIAIALIIIISWGINIKKIPTLIILYTSTLVMELPYIYGKYETLWLQMPRRQVGAEPWRNGVPCPVQHISLKICYNSSIFKFYRYIINSRRHPKLSSAFQQSRWGLRLILSHCTMFSIVMQTCLAHCNQYALLCDVSLVP